MIFQPNTYSVLLVSASKKAADSLLSLLSPGEYQPVTAVKNIAGARRLLLEQDFDIVLINSPLTDGTGIELAEDVCERTEAGVLLLTGADYFEEIRCRLTPSGAVTLPKPTSSAILALTVQTLCALRERLRKRVGRESTVEEKIRELRTVNSAKWALIRTRGISEPQAHHTIEQLAMKQRISKLQAAEQILRDIGPGAEEQN